MSSEAIGHLEQIKYGRHGQHYQIARGIVGLDIADATLQTHARINSKDATRCTQTIKALKQTVDIADKLLNFGGAVHENGYFDTQLDQKLTSDLPAGLIYNPMFELNNFRAGDVASTRFANMFPARLLNKHPYAIVTLVRRGVATELQIVNGQLRFTNTNFMMTSYLISALAQCFKREYKSLDQHSQSIISLKSAAQIALMEEALKFKSLTADHSPNR